VFDVEGAGPEAGLAADAGGFSLDCCDCV